MKEEEKFYSFDELHAEFWKYPEYKMKKDQLLIRLLWDLEKYPGIFLVYMFDTGLSPKYKICKIKTEEIKKRLKERGCEIKRKLGH